MALVSSASGSESRSLARRNSQRPDWPRRISSSSRFEMQASAPEEACTHDSRLLEGWSPRLSAARGDGAPLRPGDGPSGPIQLMYRTFDSRCLSSSWICLTTSSGMIRNVRSPAAMSPPRETLAARIDLLRGFF